MPRRSLLTLTLLAAVVLAAALLPATPAGRGWLLDRAQEAADAAGYELSWQDSGGNPWRQVTLRDARVRAPGVDAELDRATVGWFLPGLLQGELPLWVTVDGARVQLDPAALDSGGGGQGGLPVRPELRALDLAGVRLEVNDAPWTLPDLRTEELEVRGSGQGVAASGRLRTDEGALDFDARLGLAPLTLNAEVQDVDARIGRHWWRGVTAGRGEGKVTYTPEGGLRADLELRGGAIAVVGLEVTQVEGPIELRGGVVRTSLSGTGLGGPVLATGRVDVPARAWSASLRATPPLREVAAWGAGDALPPALTPDGEARLWAHASGWTDVTVDGRAEAEGTLDGRPLTLRSDEVRYTRTGGLSAAATGEALGGALTVNAGVRNDEPVWTLGLQDARYGPARDLSADATLRTGPLRGDVTARGALGDAARLQVDATLADGGVQGSVQGEVTPGGTVDGALSWQDGAVTGAVRLAGWTPAGQDPLHAELRLDGPPSELPWTLALQGEAPWTPSLPGAQFDADLRGEARGVLRGGALEEIEAALGPLSLSGRLPLATDADAGSTPAPTSPGPSPPPPFGPARSRRSCP
ncbi:MAG: hypothetical protein U5K81_06815 [Trueperaceae bacterium]|nr:hypothetical protein [Trueperaceae bacterium]